jgi:hypothetical protein
MVKLRIQPDRRSKQIGLDIYIYIYIYICGLGYAKRIESNGTAEKHEACKLDTLAHRRSVCVSQSHTAAAVSSTSRLCSGDGRRLGAGKVAEQTSIRDYPFQAMQQFVRCRDISLLLLSRSRNAFGHAALRSADLT